MLVGFAPGGSVDIVARLLAEKIRPFLNQTVIVDNKPGAAGRIALGEIKRAAPDGQMIVLAPSGALVILPWLSRNVGYDQAKDFAPIARVVTFDFAVTVGPGAPKGDINSVLAWMKANPEKANYATSGAGTAPHFAGMMIGDAMGQPLTHVPYKGGAPAASDLIGGQVPMMIDTATETIEHHRSGKVRIIAVTGAARSRALPEVPTLKESGINVTADAFFGLYGPPGMSASTSARIAAAVKEVLQMPDVQEKIYALGLTPAFGGPEELAMTQATHYKRWEGPAKASGVKID